MFERFTDRARRVVVMAQEESRRLQHDWIGTEHLLLGLMSDPEGGVKAMADVFELSLESLRTDVEARVGRGAEPPGAQIPFTPGAKKALEMSLRSALRLKHDSIAPEHILLGLLSDEKEAAMQILADRGATGEQLRAMLTDAIVASPSILLDDPMRNRPFESAGCRHPDHALVWSPVELPGPQPGSERSMIVVRCGACERAISVVDGDR